MIRLTPDATKKDSLDAALLKVFAFAKVIHLRYKSCDMWRLFKEFLLFLRQEKKWWLIPLVVILLALGALIVFSSGSVLAPFMYPFM